MSVRFTFRRADSFSRPLVTADRTESGKRFTYRIHYGYFVEGWGVPQDLPLQRGEAYDLLNHFGCGGYEASGILDDAKARAKR